MRPRADASIQRAVLIVRDVPGWSAADSALRRTPATLRDKLRPDRPERTASDPAEQEGPW
jgi:hypothetical protein